MTTPVVIAGTNYTAESVETTFDTDAVIQARIIGLHNIAVDTTLAFDGDRYLVDDVTWEQPAGVTKVRGLRALDADAVRRHILTILLPQLEAWAATDPFFARLVEVAGGAVAYARLVQQDFGSNPDLSGITRALRNNLLDIQYLPDTDPGAPCTLIPVWRTLPAAASTTVYPVGAVAYRRQGSLGSALSAATVQASNIEDAKAAVATVLAALATYLDPTVATAQTVADAVDQTFRDAVAALPSVIDDTVRGRDWTAAEVRALTTLRLRLGGILAANDYQAVQVADHYVETLVRLLQALLPQYSAVMGTEYARAVTNMPDLGRAVRVVADWVNAVAVYLRQIRDMERRYFITNVYRQTLTITGALSTAYILTEAQTDLNELAAKADLVVVSSEVAPWGAEYLDDDELTVRVFPTGVRGQPRVRWIRELQPDLSLAVLRVMQADALARMDAGRVTLSLAGVTVPQYGRVTADMDLPNAVTQYRAEGVRTRHQGQVVEATVDAAALPPDISTTPVGRITAYHRAQVTGARVVAEPAGWYANQPLSTLGAAVTTDLTARAILPLANGRVVVARQGVYDDDRDLSLASRRYGTDDFLYVYDPSGAAPNAAVAVTRDTGRRASIAAAATALAVDGVYSLPPLLYNAQVAGYALAVTTAGNVRLLVACLGYGRTGNPALSYDVPILSWCDLGASDYAFGAWTTLIARPGTDGSHLSRTWSDAGSRNTSSAFQPVVYHNGALWEIASLTHYGRAQNWYSNAGAPAESLSLNDVTLGPATTGGTDYLDARWGVGGVWPTAGWYSGVGPLNQQTLRAVSLSPDGKLWYRPSSAAHLLELGDTGIRNPGCLQALGEGEYMAVGEDTQVWRVTIANPVVTAPITSR